MKLGNHDVGACKRVVCLDTCSRRVQDLLHRVVRDTRTRSVCAATYNSLESALDGISDTGEALATRLLVSLAIRTPMSVQRKRDLGRP
jgi:hypothetical protein